MLGGGSKGVIFRDRRGSGPTRLWRRAVWAAALLLAVVALPATAAAGTIRVGQGDSVVLHLRLPAHHVVVGDPAVANVVMENAKTMSIFGREPGGTTLTVMDGAGRTLIDAQLMVQPAASDGVAVTLGTGRNVATGGTVLSYVCDATSCVEKSGKGLAGK